MKPAIVSETNINKQNNDHKSFLASSLFFKFASTKVGTKAAEKAPSAKRSLNKFGIRQATKKASVKPEAPKRQAINCSQTNPRIRLQNVAMAIFKDEKKTCSL